MATRTPKLNADDVLPPATWARLMRGDPMRASTFAQVDDALKWERGSCIRIARREGTAVEIDDDTRTLVIELPPEVQAATVQEVWLSGARLTAEAQHLPPDMRGKAVALVNKLLDDYKKQLDDHGTESP